MPFLWLAVPDDAGRATARGFVERNSIALLSAIAGGTDRTSSGWLGHHVPSEKVRHSGLWNVNHVDDRYAPTFLETLTALVDRMR